MTYKVIMESQGMKMKQEKQKKFCFNESLLGRGIAFIFPKESVEAPTQSHSGLEEALENIT